MIWMLFLLSPSSYSTLTWNNNHMIRNDPDVGMIARYHMIEICINPENEVMGGSALLSYGKEYPTHNSFYPATSTFAEANHALDGLLRMANSFLSVIHLPLSWSLIITKTLWLPMNPLIEIIPHICPLWIPPPLITFTSSFNGCDSRRYIPGLERLWIFI